MHTLIKNAVLINEGSRKTGNLLIEDNIISKIYGPEISGKLPSQTRAIDAAGLWLLPGVIDDQVHFRDPGLTHKGDFHTGSIAAAAGGVTSVMDMPNTRPQTVTMGDLNRKMEMAARKSLVNYSFYLGATNDNLKEIEKADPSKVCGIKVFMGASTGNMLVDREKSLETIFASAPCLVAVHCEDENTIRKNTRYYKEKFGDNIPIRYHPLIRSEEACYLSSSKAVRLARKHGARLHILHLSTLKELSLFDPEIPLKDKKITGEVCVHHLWFDDSDYEKYGTRIKWNPAIKTKHDREGLLQGLLQNQIDVIATDHAPHTIEEKNQPYFKAPSGGPLVQHSLSAMLELASRGYITPEKVVEKMCHAPADLFRIDKRGYLREGYYADLVLVDPRKPLKVKKDNLLYKCGWSPFEGITFGASVVSTFVNGHLAYHNGNMDESIKGRPLIFNRS